MSNELWKPINNYDGLYEISNFGRVKSLPRKTTKGGILKLSQNNDGYNIVCLYDKNAKKKTFRVCRLVAIAFVKNPYGFKEVNHKDKNVKNDNFLNLEWCDRKYNVGYSKNRKVKSIDEDGKEVIFNSIYETRLYGYNYGNVNRCCKDGNKHKGLRWEYVE